MSLTKIAPEDFVSSNDSLSTSCWRDIDGNPIGNNEFTPTWSTQTVSVMGDTGVSIGSITNYYLGTLANLQFSRTQVSKSFPLTTLQRRLYGFIRNVVYGDKNAIFEWNGSEVNTFTVTSISKNCLKSSLLPGSLRIGGIYTDDSNINPPRILSCGRAYNIAQATSFSGGGFPYGFATGNPVGLFLPDVGLIIHDAFLSPSSFVLGTENLTPSQHVFIRAKNNQYNYSMNPSFISRNSGKIIHQDWYDNPQTYITTVGLYNDNNELMATAKLPRPYNKNFNNELLMQIGLNF
jgi:hypothetical protein